MLLNNKINNNGFGTPLAHFPELEGKVEPMFLAISGKPTDDQQKQLDSFKNYKKLEKFVKGHFGWCKLTLYVRYKNGYIHR